MPLTTEERLALGRLMETRAEPAEDAPDYVYKELASVLLGTKLEELTQAVKNEIADWRLSRVRALDYYNRQYFIFLAPLPKGAKPEIIYESDEIVTVKDPQRQPVRVRRSQFQAFCKENRLDPKEMEKVGMGEEYEHRGYHRMPGLSGGLHLGREWQPPYVPDAPTPKNQRTVRRAFQWAAEVVDWTPDK